MDASDPQARKGTEARPLPGPKRKDGGPSGPDEVRAAVLAAAADLFGEQGVESTSIREVAARANVNSSLIVRYIGPREDLIEAVYRQVTSMLVADVHDRPLRAHSFERDSTMGRWTVLVTYYALHQELAPAELANPVTAIAEAISTHYGSDDATARWRAAQIVASALGWRLFEQQVMAMAGLGPEVLADIRTDLTVLHNIAGARSLPTEDPRPPDQR